MVLIPNKLCNLNLASSVNMQCWQWWVSQTRWCVAHWRLHWRCTNLGYRAGRRERNPVTRRSSVMVRTDRRCPVRRISWALSLGLDRKLLASIILSKYQSSRSGEILWQWPRGIWLVDPLCGARFKNAIGTLCVTRNPSIINLSAPFTEKLNDESQYFTLNGSWHCLNFAKSIPDGRFNQWHSSKSNPIRPFSWHTTLTSNESAHSKLHEMYSQGNSSPKTVQYTTRN